MKILVVDDEQVQVESIRRGLFLFGHEVLPVTESRRAEEILRSPEGDDIDLMLTDMTMPGCSGLELIELVGKLRPELPVVVLTGLTSSAEVDEVRARGIPILTKPFAPEQLDRAIQSLVGSRSGISRSSR